MNKQLNIILNGKGGVGKSFFATNFVQYLKDRQIEHHTIETDDENATLTRFHSEAEFIDLAKLQELDRIFVSFAQTALVIVDCRAASTDLFLDYFKEIRVFEILEQLGVALTVISPVNHEADSVEQLKAITDTLKENCRYLIVRNQVHSEQFRIYEQSHVRSRILDELAGREIVMPRLYDWLVTGLNETNLTITDAIKHPAFSLVDRQRLKNWQREFDGQIDAVRELILPNGEPPKSAGRAKKAKSQPVGDPATPAS